jgi:hypothetical protein
MPPGIMPSIHPSPTPAVTVGLGAKAKWKEAPQQPVAWYASTHHPGQVESFDEEERARLLQFCTGACRVPAQGFKALQSNDGNYRRFNIQSVRRQDCPFPRAHTCFNKYGTPVAHFMCNHLFFRIYPARPMTWPLRGMSSLGAAKGGWGLAGLVDGHTGKHPK